MTDTAPVTTINRDHVDLCELLADVLTFIVEFHREVKVTPDREDKVALHLHVQVNTSDIKHVIGKEGRTINALRLIMSIAGFRLIGKPCYVDIVNEEGKVIGGRP